MATINPSQDYDIIYTLTYESSGGTDPIRLYRGSTSAFTGTVYYRAGTSGAWTSLAVSGTSTTFPITSTTMQIAHDWNKPSINYMTPSFMSGTMTGIAISQKAALSGVMGGYFMYNYAYGCTKLTSLAAPDTSGLTSIGDYFMYSYASSCQNLTSLAVPDTSGLTSVGSGFMAYYANNCYGITSLDVPDTSGLTSVGNSFMTSYANNCYGLTSLDVPDTSGLTSVGNSFMAYYAYYCYYLTTLAVPDTSGLTSVGNSFMDGYAYYCYNLTQLNLPNAGWFKTNNVDWSVPSERLGLLHGDTTNSTDQADWQALTVSGKTLHTNYIQSGSNVWLNDRPPVAIKDYATSLIETAPSPATTGTSLTVSSGHGVRFPEAPFQITVHPAYEMPTLDNAEKLMVTAKSGDVFTIERSRGDTTAKSIAAGWRITNALFAEDLMSLDSAIDDVSGRVDGKANSAHTHHIDDLTATGTKSSSTYLRGDNTWGTPPDTSYSDISTTEIDAGTSTTSRTITGATAKYIIDKAKEGKAEASDLTAHTGSTSNPHSVTKSQVGLGDVDNTSDANKPVSTATQTALDGKANSSHTHGLSNLNGGTSAGVLKTNSSGVVSAGSVGSDNIDWATLGAGHYEVGVEKPTGATFGDKPVYRKVISISALPNNEAVNYRFAPDGTTDEVVSFGGVGKRTSNGVPEWFPLPFVSTIDSLSCIMLLGLSDFMRVQAGSNRSNISAVIWVEYTKL